MRVSNEDFSINDLSLDLKVSEAQEIATSLLSDKEIFDRLTNRYHGPLLSVRDFILAHERGMVAESLKLTIEDFQDFKRDSEDEYFKSFAGFKDSIYASTGDLLFVSEEEGTEPLDMYKSWVDVYMHALFRFRPDLRTDPQRFITFIRTELLDAGLGNDKQAEKRIADIKFLIVKEAISYVMRKNNFAPSRADWAVFNSQGYNSHEASSLLVDDLVDHNVIDLSAKEDSYTKSVIASYFALFRRFDCVSIASVENDSIPINTKKWQKSNSDFIEFMNLWSDSRRFFEEFYAVLSNLSSIKRLKGDLDIELVPSGPYVLAAWLDFYAMIKFFRKNMQKGNVELEKLIEDLISEFNKEGILDAHIPYAERVLKVKSMLYREIVDAWQ